MSGEKLDGVFREETPSTVLSSCSSLMNVWAWTCSGAQVAFGLTCKSVWRVIQLIATETAEGRAALWESMLQDDPGLVAWLLQGPSTQALERAKRDGSWSRLALYLAETVRASDLGKSFLQLRSVPNSAWSGAECLRPVTDRLSAAAKNAPEQNDEDRRRFLEFAVRAVLARPLPFGRFEGRSSSDAVDRQGSVDWFTILKRHAGQLAVEVWEQVEQLVSQVDEVHGGISPDEECPSTDVGEQDVSRLTEKGHILRHLLRDAAAVSHDAFRESLERAKLEAMKELAYGASHEINNPLANIASRAQLLLRNEKDPERRRALATIHGQAMRAHEMIADMMYFAKPPALCRQTVDLKELLERWRQLMMTEIPTGIQWDWSVADTSHVYVDPTQCLTALQAIGRNAVEAMEGHGVLGCQTSVGDAQGPAESSGIGEDGGWRWILLRDTGPGIPSDVLHHLFDPFFSGREAGRGLGLGLSKAWRIVTEHGGVLRAESGPQGACFSLGFPPESPDG